MIYKMYHNEKTMNKNVDCKCEREYAYIKKQ